MHIAGSARRGGALMLLAGSTAALSACGAQTGPAKVAVADADAVASRAPASTSRPAAAKPKRTGPLRRTEVDRRPARRILDGTDPIVVGLGGAPDPQTARPKFIPAVPGRWANVGDTEVFTPASTLAPCSTYHLYLPSATRALGHHKLGSLREYQLHVTCPGAHAAQLALARLRYLPYSVHGRSGVALGGKETRGAAAQAAFHVTQTLKRRIKSAPAIKLGTLDPVTKGALMSFADAHGLPTDGTLDATTWRVLLSAEANGSNRRDAYTWVTVTKSSPETLRLHRGDKVLVRTAANTGVPGADTPDGTFPIYSRLPSTTMIGTNVDGSKYDDPGVLWVNYFNGGDAVHAFERGSYGSPQSNGCVELPTDAASRVYQQLHIGDPVVVQD